jgi:aminoglycoside 2''-phosphotransferase
MNLDNATKLISTHFSDLTVNSISLAGAGYDSDAYLLNDEFIFLFPKHERAIAPLELELSFLPVLQKNLKLPIPQFAYTARSQNGQLLFVGYPVIRGESADKDLLKKEPAYIIQLAEFFKELHSFPLTEALKYDLEKMDTMTEYGKLLADSRDKIFPLLDSATVGCIEKLFNSYLQAEEKRPTSYAVLHADLSLDHVLCDIPNKSIAGIIDWGDLRIGDPIYDLRYLYEDLETDFSDIFLPAYTKVDKKHILDKLSFYSIADSLQGAFLGLKSGDTARIKKELEMLKELSQ